MRVHDDQDADLCGSLLRVLQRWDARLACAVHTRRGCGRRPHCLLASRVRRARAEIPILIAIAFWLSGGFIRSGLGARIAYSIVALFGKTTLVSAAALRWPARWLARFHGACDLSPWPATCHPGLRPVTLACRA